MSAYIDTFSIDENNVQFYLFVNYSYYCVILVLVWLLLLYETYSTILNNSLEKTRLPKLYRNTAVHSLWMGTINLLLCVTCFTQLNILVCPHIPTNSKQIFVKEALYAATARFCQSCTNSNISYSGTTSKAPAPAESFQNAEVGEWNTSNAVTLIIISAVLIQEIFLALRSQKTTLLYSCLFAFIFVNAAAKTRCPILGIQGAYLITANESSKEIARALTALKSYSQEDPDARPSLPVKVATFSFFVLHMLIWFSFMFFFMPYFLHKLPSVGEMRADQSAIAYTYLALLAYVAIEVGFSPLWVTMRCMAWCRRGSGMSWRILALADCHLLGHYSPLVLDLYNIQTILNHQKAQYRDKMIQKHLKAMDERKKNRKQTAPVSRTPNLLTAVKALMALKKKIQRHRQAKKLHAETSCENLPQIPHVIAQPEDASIAADICKPTVETISHFESEDDDDPGSESMLNCVPGGLDISDFSNMLPEEVFRTSCLQSAEKHDSKNKASPSSTQEEKFGKNLKEGDSKGSTESDNVAKPNDTIPSTDIDELNKVAKLNEDEPVDTTAARENKLDNGGKADNSDKSDNSDEPDTSDVPDCSDEPDEGDNLDTITESDTSSDDSKMEKI